MKVKRTMIENRPCVIITLGSLQWKLRKLKESLAEPRFPAGGDQGAVMGMEIGRARKEAVQDFIEQELLLKKRT